MKKFLYLDDDAFHPEKTRDPEIYYLLIGAEDVLEKMKDYEVTKVISVEEAKEYIETNGCPNFISFDNDLQRELEGIHLAHWIVEQDLDSPGFLPGDFSFLVHSQNPIARERIYSYLNEYLSFKSNNDLKNKSLKP